jgi:RNA polymerase sigma factor (TIGR02999 family)
MGGHTVAARPGDSAAPSEGDRRALDLLYSVTYEELRRLAANVRRGSLRLSLIPTTLVNEAWAKLAGSPGVAATSRIHFKRIAARAMREVLVDAARKKYARKRGGRDVVFVTLDDASMTVGSTPGELLALDAALEELARRSPRQARMVEYRFFGGLDVAETATLLEVSEATVLRDWRVVKAWLAKTCAQGR